MGFMDISVILIINVVMIISKENIGFFSNTTNLRCKKDVLSSCSVLESLLSAEQTNE